MFGITKKQDYEFIRKIHDANIEEVKFWRVPNLLIPSIIILITVLIYVFFQPFDDVTFEGCLNFLVNGSIPLIAVNQIAGVGIYIFKYNKAQESELGIESTRRIRTELFYQVFCLLLLCSLLYAYQTINQPFGNLWKIVIVFAISIIFLFCSYKVSKKLYLLQDEFINLAYDVTIRETVIETTTTQNWDEYEADEQ